MENTQNNPDKTKAEQINLTDSLAKKNSHKKRCNKFLEIAGLVILSAVIYLVLFINGKPTIDTDYLAELNKLNKPENYKEEDNAWPYYQKAFELYKDPNYGKEYEVILDSPRRNFSDLNEPEQKIVLNWIELNQAAWQELVKATQKPYCYIEYKLRSKEDDVKHPESLDAPTFKIDFQSLNNLSPLAILGQRRIETEIENKNMEQAINDCFVLLCMSPQWQQNKFFFEQLHSRQFNSYGCQVLLKILAKTDFQVTQLHDIQKRLTNLYNLDTVSFDFGCNKIVFLDAVQHTFTKGVLGGGHLIPKYIKPLVNIMVEPETKMTFQQYILYLLYPKYMKSWLENKYKHTVYINNNEIKETVA